VIQLGELVMILDLHRQGLGVSAIARRVGIDRKTVRKYGPRKPRPRRLEPFEAYLRQRVVAYPSLTGSRLLREIREQGYDGGYTAVTDFLREVRPRLAPPFEVRFETPPGEQAQVDFAQFEVVFADEPGVVRKVWLFSLVLGYSRLIWARFVAHQHLQTVLRCHMAAFTALGGVPREILYDRMKTAVIGEDAEAHPCADRACRSFPVSPESLPAYRAKTKGKVERPFRYNREDFFLARAFRNLGDLNAQLAHWLATVANPRVHATTRRVVNEAFAEERLHLLPAVPFSAVLKLERRVSHEGMVSVGGNLYSVPDATRKRVVEVHSLAEEIRIFGAGRLIAIHPVLEGRHQRRVAPGRCRMLVPRAGGGNEAIPIGRAGDVVARRSLDFYEAVARRLAAERDRPCPSPKGCPSPSASGAS
jgi:transposase